MRHVLSQDEREKRALRAPLDLRERLRLALKVPTPFLAYLWFQEQPVEATGAAALTAFAATMGVLSIIELLWLPRSAPRERIFTSTQRQALALHAATIMAAAAALAFSVPRLP